MGISKQYVQGIIDVYVRAWEERDPDLICTIFTPAATYHERVMGEPIAGLDGIRSYWETKVVAAQANITCRPSSLYVDGSTAIAEWLAEFDDVAQGVRKRMKEIAVLEFEWTMARGYLISSLREYWASETIPGYSSGPPPRPAAEDWGLALS
jgi:hypothetical protein